jgi:acyl-CoA synthetase (AMP-forming)/AMP-acid ligase II
MSDVQPPSVCNIAAALPGMALLQGQALAVVAPAGHDAQGKRRYQRLTYQQLDQQSDVIAHGLRACGLSRGMRTVLMVKPSLAFFALTFGLFKAGIVPVMIDPGLGIKQLKACLAEVAPQAFIGIPAAHLARLVLGWGRGSIRHLVTVGRRYAWGGSTLAQVIAAGQGRGALLEATQADETAAILFTSGSTGIAKGVVYSHGNFMAQVDLIRQTYDIQPGEIDLPTFPLFALFDPALGMTTILPEMDFTRPAKVDPEKIRAAIDDWQVTNVFASPALLNTVARHGVEHAVRWPSVKRVLSAGAPVPAITLERMHQMLAPSAEIFTPYGATEVLPVASIGSREILANTCALTQGGAGVCVGRVVPPNEVRIIEISDAALPEWAKVRELAAGEIGEICVRGPTVTSAYFGRPAATHLAKIDCHGQIVHRMGDVGYFDGSGRLWFCGRKSQRVELADRTLFSAPVEEIFNTHAGVFRTALVGVTVAGVRVPVLCVELESASALSGQALLASLRMLGEKFAATRGITHFLIHPGFPVDVRHNAKIGREKLALWAHGRLA